MAIMTDAPQDNTLGRRNRTVLSEMEEQVSTHCCPSISLTRHSPALDAAVKLANHSGGGKGGWPWTYSRETISKPFWAEQVPGDTDMAVIFCLPLPKHGK